ncbi:MAG: hypothetical protein JSV65_08820 [Armatimonadota bacterium]|nr:MAG: hypothetical protein JSV65_08820 [Armatimonadota bacterium]
MTGPVFSEPRRPRFKFVPLAWHPWLGVAARVVLGGVLICAGIGKAFQPADFARLIYGYHVLHMDLVNLPPLWLPWIELLTGALLVVLGAGGGGAPMRSRRG